MDFAKFGRGIYKKLQKRSYFAELVYSRLDLGNTYFFIFKGNLFLGDLKFPAPSKVIHQRCPQGGQL
jgi:hypothetical protein